MSVFKKIISNQFRKPAGLLGHYAAHFMKKNNHESLVNVCNLLDPQNDDHLLEIGCGAGYAIQLITEKNNSCRVDAIDFSPMMQKKAQKHNRQCIDANRVRIYHGDFINHDFSGSAYSKIFAVNVIYFWNDLSVCFSKILGLLKPGGRFIFLMSSPERLNHVPFADNSVFNKYTINNVESALLQSGFARVTYETKSKNGLDVFYVCAEK
jgi:SAM-dependent methyltransferase